MENKEIVGELDFITKQLYQLKDVRPLMLEMAHLYKTDEAIQKSLDETYDQGTATFIGEAIEAFYQNSKL